MKLLKVQCKKYLVDLDLLKEINEDILEVDQKLYGIQAKRYDTIKTNNPNNNKFFYYYDKKEKLLNEKEKVLKHKTTMEQFLFHDLPYIYQDMVWRAYIKSESISSIADDYQVSYRSITKRLNQANNEFIKAYEMRGVCGVQVLFPYENKSL